MQLFFLITVDTYCISRRGRRSLFVVTYWVIQWATLFVVTYWVIQWATLCAAHRSRRQKSNALLWNVRLTVIISFAEVFTNWQFGCLCMDLKAIWYHLTHIASCVLLSACCLLLRRESCLNAAFLMLSDCRFLHCFMKFAILLQLASTNKWRGLDTHDST
jgi:hypothetical protein